MKDHGKTRFCLDLQVDHLRDRIFIYQSTYIEKAFERFYMDKAYSLNTLMIVHSLDVKNNIFLVMK